MSDSAVVDLRRNLQLEGGAAEEEGRSSSGSLDLLRPPRAACPRFAADMLGRSGELVIIRWASTLSHGWEGTS